MPAPQEVDPSLSVDPRTNPLSRGPGSHSGDQWPPSGSPTLFAPQYDGKDSTPNMRTTPLPPNLLIPSGLYTITPDLAAAYTSEMETSPKLGDVYYGEVTSVGHHLDLESKTGRIHQVLTPGYRCLVVFGNRYATDAYEARIPAEFRHDVDLVSRSMVIGTVNQTAHGHVAAPTKIRLLGQVLDPDDQPLNTIDHGTVHPRRATTNYPRAQMILVVGTSMNAGKSTTAVAAGRALIAAGHTVKGSKVTGTASLKEILNMQDAGAINVSDFTYLGYPSTYLLPKRKILSIFNRLDRRYANNPDHYWIVEVADGIMQRETAMLLSSPDVRNRIGRLLLCASDACGALGAITELKENYGLAPDVISGIVGSSPLARTELTQRTDITVCDSRQADTTPLADTLTATRHPRPAAA